MLHKYISKMLLSLTCKELYFVLLSFMSTKTLHVHLKYLNTISTKPIDNDLQTDFTEALKTERLT